MDHLNVALESAGEHGPLQELGAAIIRIEQNNVGVGPFGRQDQSRQPSTGTQVEDTCRFVTGLGPGQGDKAHGVAQMPLYRSRSEKARLASRKEYRSERS
jgi:hypothetical protein